MCLLCCRHCISADPSCQKQSRVLLPSKHGSVDHGIPNPGLAAALPSARIRGSFLDAPRTKPREVHLLWLPGRHWGAARKSRRWQSTWQEVRGVRLMGSFYICKLLQIPPSAMQNHCSVFPIQRGSLSKAQGGPPTFQHFVFASSQVSSDNDHRQTTLRVETPAKRLAVHA